MFAEVYIFYHKGDVAFPTEVILGTNTVDSIQPKKKETFEIHDKITKSYSTILSTWVFLNFSDLAQLFFFFIKFLFLSLI